MKKHLPQRKLVIKNTFKQGTHYAPVNNLLQYDYFRMTWFQRFCVATQKGYIALTFSINGINATYTCNINQHFGLYFIVVICFL